MPSQKAKSHNPLANFAKSLNPKMSSNQLD
jgi:hypothetical protein